MHRTGRSGRSGAWAYGCALLVISTLGCGENAADAQSRAPTPVPRAPASGNSAATPDLETWRTRYRAARALEERPSWAEAAEAWRAFAEGPDFLRTHARARQRQAHFRVRQCQEYLALDPTDLSEIVVCLAATGQSTVLTERLQSFLRSDARPNVQEAFWQTAWTHFDGNNVQRAALLRRMAIRYAADGYVQRTWPLARIETELQTLGGAALTTAERRQRAETLERARMYELAEQTLTAIRPRNTDERVRLLRQRGDLLFRGRNYPQAETLFQEAAGVSGRCASCNVPSDEFMAIRAHIRATHGENGMPLLENFVRRYGRAASARESVCEAFGLSAGLLAEELASHPGRHENNRTLLTKLVSARQGAQTGRCGNDASFAFREGFARYLLVQHAENSTRANTQRELARARTALLAMGAAELPALERTRMHYWVGRIAEQEGNTESATAEWERVQAIEPLGYYSVLLAGENRNPSALTRTGPLAVGASSSHAEQEAVLGALGYFLVRAGYPRDAASLVESRQNEIRSRFGAAMLAEAFRLVEKPEQSFRTESNAWPSAAQLTRANATEQEQADQRLRIFFPTPYRDAVHTHATAAQISPWLVYAVMRQESGYNPRVISPAGAVGLLQIMPRVGTRIAGREMDTAALQNAGTNLELGIRHLGELVQRYGVPFCFAAYNAGGERVVAWRTRFGALSLTEQIEMIPYDETRNYVRRVSSHWARYAYLYETAPALPEILPRS